MRTVSTGKIRAAVKDLCVKANTVIRPDIRKALSAALRKETNRRAKSILKVLIENAGIAGKEKAAICQDTGLVVVQVAVGRSVKLTGAGLDKAINGGVKEGYAKGCFRSSVVAHPLLRAGKYSAVPAVIYTDIIDGNKVKITVSPKGFGSENKSRIKMFNPTDSAAKIMDFIIETVKLAGPNACPPYIIGVGIGGTFDRAALLSKKALFRPIDKRNTDRTIAGMEKDLLREINALGIGPMGLGGKTTCLGVNILAEPTHMAGLPVAVNISCHATRSATTVL